jgi:phospholipid-binding lipoprotein MlaA
MTIMRTLRAGLVALALVSGMVGCGTAPVVEGDEPIEPVFSADRVIPPDVTYPADIPDPWQGFNRTMYRFNYRFDRYVFLPVVRGYQAITPDFLEQGIHNFFTNIRNITTLINSILQASPRKAGDTTGRFLVNTTMGLLGVFDVATFLEIPQHEEDFGQTLGVWGVGSGPYLVLPILGPSSVRDGVGTGADAFVMMQLRNELDLETWQEWTWTALNAIDRRANVPFRYYETGSAFEYDFVRWLWFTKRRLDIEK